MIEKKHLFNDGDKVRVKETGEIVTVELWWFREKGTTQIAQYDVEEYPNTWFSESELESI